MRVGYRCRAESASFILIVKTYAGFQLECGVLFDVQAPCAWTMRRRNILLVFHEIRQASSTLSLERLRDHLQKGVRVSLVSRDRDYQCNWFGGVKSLATHAAQPALMWLGTLTSRLSLTLACWKSGR